MGTDHGDADSLESRRRACWLEFTNAAERAAFGDYRLAADLVERHPAARTELWAFAKAIEDGKIVRDGDRFNPVKP
jgi:hypothetical protein